MKTIGKRVRANKHGKVDAELRCALAFMRGRIVLGPPRVVRADALVPVGYSGLGAVLVVDGAPITVHVRRVHSGHP